MGRTRPSVGLAPPAFRKDARAKKAKTTINKVIPALLSAHPRARKGIDSSELITLANLPKEKDAVPGASLNKQNPRITLRVTDTLAAAHSLLATQNSGEPDLSNRKARVVILNMASPLSPGGGFLNGASSQEESLCMRTTLLPSLRDSFYRLPELGAIYTPDVLVHRDEQGEDLSKSERWFVDCVSAAMLRQPDTDVDSDGAAVSYANPRDRELIAQKMHFVMNLVQAKGARSVVLGAWGCGAYSNPVGEVATAWKSVLMGSREGGGDKNWHGIEDIVFAIKDKSLAEKFAEYFGDGITRDDEASNTPSEGGEDLEDTEMGTLSDKIRETKASMEQAKSPHLKLGLSRVLSGLEDQLRTQHTQQPASESG
ncbi:hypothetical protein B0H67DRAFT_547107 [Lasiosphaeris hirsuta]|uniref:Microbial-type PARG catalytic domain-containing protein n=1 Tax=Lasiosphaeris hirsuta TaxID=260670 RepID=A0AA40DJF8_9PEZI|nr:hypothetical protein B0H67DRAFT_547107 [Lasiosphaeris hirsuta]